MRRVNSTSSSDEHTLLSPLSQLKKIVVSGDVKLRRPADILLAEDNAVNQVIFKYVAPARAGCYTKFHLLFVPKKMFSFLY